MASDEEEKTKWRESVLSASKTSYNDVKTLLEKTPDLVNIIIDENHQRSALHIIAISGDVVKMRIVISSSSTEAAVNKVDCDQNTPLHLALKRKNYACAEVLLDCAQINVNLLNSEKESPLLRLIKNEYSTFLFQFLQFPSVDVNCENERQETALHYASNKGCLSSVSLLLKHKDIDVNKKDLCGYTALHVAALYGHINVMNKLIEAGANVEIMCNSGFYPLHIAILYWSEDRLKLQTMIDILMKSHTGQSVLKRWDNEHKKPQNAIEMVEKRGLLYMMERWSMKVHVLIVQENSKKNAHLILQHNLDAQMVIICPLDNTSHDAVCDNDLLDNCLVNVSKMCLEQLSLVQNDLCDDGVTEVKCGNNNGMILEKRISLKTAMDIQDKVDKFFIETEHDDPEMEQFGIWKLKGESDGFLVKLSAGLAKNMHMIPLSREPNIQLMRVYEKADLQRVHGQDSKRRVLDIALQKKYMALLRDNVLFCFSDRKLVSET